MTTTRLLLTLDRGPDAAPGECGGCVKRAYHFGWYCTVFGDAVNGSGVNGPGRLPACLAAERAAGEAERLESCVAAADDLLASVILDRHNLRREVARLYGLLAAHHIDFGLAPKGDDHADR